MAKITRRGREKLGKVIRYIAYNYNLENFRGDLQLARLLKFLELLNHKYEIVEYDEQGVVNIVKSNKGLVLKERSSVYGNSYRCVTSRGVYEGEDLDKEVRNILDKEMGYTREMSYSTFCTYIYNEVKRGVSVDLI